MSITLATGARRRARELWYSIPEHPYCMRVGISSWEGLWCRFEGERPEVRALRAWAPTYRREAWRLALIDQGIRDDQLADELGECFGAERRSRHELFDDARAALEAVAESYSLALVTNGASCLQREKLQAVGLSEYFESVVVSSDLGVAKPSVAIFAHALDQLRVKGEHATMVGDSLTRDVEGAIAAGLRGIWLGRCRTTTPHQTDRLDRTLNADRVACHPRELTVQASKPAISRPPLT